MQIKFPEWVGNQPELDRVLDLNLTNLEPWAFYFDQTDFATRVQGLKERYPNVDLIPFARREDCDDIVCWEKSQGTVKVFVVHDFSSNGWDKRREFKDFWEWYREAVNSMIEHEAPYR